MQHVTESGAGVDDGGGAGFAEGFVRVQEKGEVGGMGEGFVEEVAEEEGVFEGEGGALGSVLVGGFF